MKRATSVLLILVGAAAVGAALVTVAYQRDISRAREEVRRGAVVVDTTVGPIEYAEHGSGFPLLSIHGAGGGYDQGLANVAELVGGGFRVIAPSRFGYLGTPIPADHSSSAQADAHAALLARLHIDRAVIVGISAGAVSAIEFALRHPQKTAALVLIVPGTYSPDSPVTIEGSRANRFVFWLVNNGADFAWWATERIAPSVLVRFIGVPPELLAASPPAERDGAMAIVANIQPLSLRFPGLNIDSTPDLHPLPLEQITAPTLVMSARDDLFNTLPAARFAASGIPNARLIVYDTGGHLLVGHGADARAAIREFLVTAGTSPAP